MVRLTAVWKASCKFRCHEVTPVSIVSSGELGVIGDGGMCM